ncbi:MAG TPA: hypothetical protein VGI81_08575 [Tepidisphaeraceae bacterium]
MRTKVTGMLLLLAAGLVGCGGPARGPVADAQYWADRIPAGTSLADAKRVMADNDFEHWQSGNVLYGYRDKVASKDYSNGVTLSAYLDESGRVAYTEARSTPIEPYPLVWPTYP